MPSYNSAKTIERAVQSVLLQTYQDLELIIIDDYSSDETLRIVEKIKDNRVRLIRLSQNSGVAVARNTGIKAATGRYIAFLDSDDSWHPEKLARQQAFMATNNIGFSFTAYYRNEPNGKRRFVPAPVEMTYKKLLRNTIIGCLTVMVDRTIVGHFTMPNIRTRQDTATWLAILKKGTHAYGLNEGLAFYQVEANTLSGNKVKMMQQTWKMYREQEKLTYVHTLYNFIGYAYQAIKKRISGYV
ncbi:glycosyltransferase family 2 protein [Paenilisteria rocourtiae]|uniref:Teichuronic acid biosynthesis glycosyltransferase TuaG n=1 Tax=Listeria rocourtiae TaxID=647910 RepID=A0A4R6ZPQ9_9LIST|nr:glycosyltransferase family 2 protein [Listeria rocourtiae]MBC1434764.1 glycosyltransferase family 2 protein [Listeria rocourtiae]TDR54550.1 teichuronic acid biosynthesis glycosyltransferase TuaG [Listeria rocourtiae]